MVAGQTSGVYNPVISSANRISTIKNLDDLAAIKLFDPQSSVETHPAEQTPPSNN